MPQSIEHTYAPLAAYLVARANAGVRYVTLPFDSIEKTLLQRPLPSPARAEARWWQVPGHAPQAWYGWLRVGWRVAAVDLGGETVTFVREVATA